MKQFIKLFSLVLLFLVIGCGLVGCTEANTKESVSRLSYVSIRINPEIELVLDENKNVVAVNAINEDGELVLCELDLIGLSAEEAVEMITSKAVELGFIDINAEEAIVYVFAECDNEEEEKELEDKIHDKVDKFFDEKGIFGKCTKEKVEEFKELAEEWQVSLKEAKLISRILELYPEMTLEEVLELSKEELRELVKEEKNNHGFPNKVKEEYKEAVENIKEECKEYFELQKQLKQLEKQLKDETLSEEEKATLQAEYDSLKAQYDVLIEEYKAKLEEVKEEKKQKVEEFKEKIKEEVNKRHEKYEQYKELAKEWGVSLKKAKLISTILELYPEKTIEELLQLTKKELQKLINGDEDSKTEDKPENPKTEEDSETEEKPNIHDKFEEELDKVKEKFTNFFDIAMQIADIKKQMKEELSEEELAVLQEQLDTLMEQYESLKDEYKSNVNKTFEDQQKELEEEMNKWCKEHHNHKKGK